MWGARRFSGSGAQNPNPMPRKWTRHLSSAGHWAQAVARPREQLVRQGRRDRLPRVVPTALLRAALSRGAGNGGSGPGPERQCTGCLCHFMGRAATHQGFFGTPPGGTGQGGGLGMSQGIGHLRRAVAPLKVKSLGPSLVRGLVLADERSGSACAKSRRASNVCAGHQTQAFSPNSIACVSYSVWYHVIIYMLPVCIHMYIHIYIYIYTHMYTWYMYICIVDTQGSERRNPSSPLRTLTNNMGIVLWFVYRDIALSLSLSLYIYIYIYM